MAYAVGIDLGSSSCKAAIFSDGGLTAFDLEPSAPGVGLTSTVRLGPAGTLTIGAAEAEAGGSAKAGDSVTGFRARLGDPSPLLLGSSPYSVETLLATLLAECLNRITAAQGERPELMVLTCPAAWGPYRREQFDDVPVLAGAGAVSIVTEAQAVAARYLAGSDAPAGELMAVYDLGAQTLDVTVLRAVAGGLPEIIGVPGARGGIAGDDVDRLLQSVLPGLPDLASCRRYKEDPGRLPTAGTTWDEFERLTQPLALAGVQLLREVARSAGCEVDELSAVVLTGGSSRIPAVGATLRAALVCPVIAVEPTTAVALGAAACAGRLLEPAAREVASPPDTRAPRRSLAASGRARLAVAAATIALLALVIVAVVRPWSTGPAAEVLLSQAQPTTASSTQDLAFTPPRFADDGNATTRWSSKFSDPQWLQIDLGRSRTIDRVVLNWESAYAVAYQLQTSDDQKTWHPIYTTVNGPGGVESIGVSGHGRYVRMYGTERVGAYGYSLFEFNVYGH